MRLALAAAVILLLPAGCGPTVTPEPPPPASSPIAPAPEIPPGEDQSAALNAWFEANFEAALKRSPMRQTRLGRKDDYGKLDDPSMSARRAELDILRAEVAEMRETFDFEALDKQAQLSWRMKEYQLARAEADWDFRYHTYPFNQMFGVQSQLPAFLIAQHSVASKSDARAYISRLNAAADYIDAYIEIAESAARRGIQPPRFVYDHVLRDARNIVTGYPFGDRREERSPLYADIRAKVEALIASGTIDGADSATLMADAVEALRERVGPAYERMITMLETQAKAANSEDGVWKLPDGAAYYAARLAAQTTTDMSAEEIHALGLAETQRIHGEMRAIMEEVEFEGSLQDFFEFMRTDPQFYKPNTAAGRAEYLAEARAVIAAMEARLPEVFNRFPEADMVVRRVEPFRERSAGKAFYQRPSADGTRPGVYYANLHNMGDMPTYQLEALAFHEGIPGHHMQLAIQQELEGVPSFRRYSGITAYSEGWGLYSEYLPKEMGFYEDPYSDFGRLAMELWRAARLVTDTGLHHKRWTREDAIDWLMANTPNPRGDAEKAIERYIVMPGQATAYSIGMLKILELRERAREALGPDFDIRDFHDVVLASGPVPLTILEENVDAWISASSTG